MTPATRILVVKRDKIGDMLLTTPLIRVLRTACPAARIEVLATDYNGWVLAGNPDVDRVYELPRIRVGRTLRLGLVPRNLALRVRLALERFDDVIVAQGDVSPRAVSRAHLVRSARMVAYTPRRAGWRLTHPLPLPPSDLHEIDRILALARSIGIEPPAVAPHPVFHLPERARRFAATWLAGRGLADGGYVVLGLGARRAARQPSADQVARWAKWWRDRYGLATVFVWTPGGSDNPIYPGDDAIADPVLRMKLADLHPYRGPLLETIGLIWQARTSVFPDSGLMHFAGASPGGVLGLFAGAGRGPLAHQWAPRGARARWLVAETDIPSAPDEQVLVPLGALLDARAATNPPVSAPTAA